MSKPHEHHWYPAGVIDRPVGSAVLIQACVIPGCGIPRVQVVELPPAAEKAKRKDRDRDG